MIAASVRAQAQDKPGLWQPQFRDVQAAEYGATLLLAAGTFAVVLWVQPPKSGGHGGFLYDDAVRDVLRLHTRGGRDAARVVGDLGFRSLMLYPFLDALVTGLAVHSDAKAAWQMAAIDAEVLAFAGFIGNLTDHVVRRARPSQRDCERDPSYERFCKQKDEFSSFVSGHSVMAAAGAGAICAHHLSMPLYGGGISDAIACGMSVAAALTTGIARIANDRHWATDVTVAFLVGAGAGYVWPRWFHYRPASSVTLHWVPQAGPDYVSGAVMGSF